MGICRETVHSDYLESFSRKMRHFKLLILNKKQETHFENGVLSTAIYYILIVIQQTPVS